MTQPTYAVIGTAVVDSLAVEKVTGATTFGIDFYKPGELIGKVLRSPYAHAEIVSIDTSAAESLPGVAAVVTYEDAPAQPVPGSNMYVLDSTVRFVGEEVAAVAAETEEVADAAVKLIKVDYNVLPAVYDATAAMQPGAPLLHEGEPLNLCSPYNPYAQASGNFAAAYAQAEVTYENTYNIPSVPVASLHRNVATADWDGEDLTVYMGSGAISGHQSELATLFNLPTSNVHIISPDMGGSFGAGDAKRVIYLAPLLAMKTGRTVKMLTSNEANQEQNCKKRHGITANVQIGANSDGTITAMSMNTVYNNGAYNMSAGTCSNGAQALFSAFNVPNMLWTTNSVYTDTPPTASYRGWGVPQPNTAMSAAVDSLAAKLGMDPTLLLSMNCIQPTSLQTYTTTDGIGDVSVTNTDFSQVGGACFVQAIEQGKSLINWSRWTPNGFSTGQPNLLGGLGVALCPYQFSGIFPFGTFNVQLTINTDGTISWYGGITDIGGGQGTVQAMIIAEALGAKYTDITPYTGDSNYPYCGTQVASQTTVGAGYASYAAATAAKQQLLAAAASQLGVPVSNLTTANSTVVNTATGAAVPFSTIMTNMGTPITTTASNPGQFQFPITTGYAMGVCFAEVNVDIWTGKVTVPQVVQMQDWGQVVNLLQIGNQMFGGLMQGLGYALSEEFVMDVNTSQIITRGFRDDRIPSFTEVPTNITLVPIQNPDPRTPFGMKGGGEAPVIAPTPAILNAIANATGLRFTTIPVTPQMIIDGLSAKGGAT